MRNLQVLLTGLQANINHQKNQTDREKGWNYEEQSNQGCSKKTILLIPFRPPFPHTPLLTSLPID